LYPLEPILATLPSLKRKSVIQPKGSNSSSTPFTVTKIGRYFELGYGSAPLFAVSGAPYHCPSHPKHKMWLTPVDAVCWVTVRASSMLKKSVPFFPIGSL